MDQQPGAELMLPRFGARISEEGGADVPATWASRQTYSLRRIQVRVRKPQIGGR